MANVVGIDTDVKSVNPGIALMSWHTVKVKVLECKYPARNDKITYCFSWVVRWILYKRTSIEAPVTQYAQ